MMEAKRQAEAIFNRLQLEALRDAIERAQGRWVGADWTHELELEGRAIYDDEGVAVYCEGRDDCDACARIEADASLASWHGLRALAALEMGDLAEADAALDKARRLELAYGDDPVWGPSARLAERLVAEAAERDVEEENSRDVIEIALDAEYDLNEAYQCACAPCCDAFSQLFEATAADVGEKYGVEIRVVRCRYGSPEEHQTDRSERVNQLWQECHDGAYWGRNDRPADCASELVECEP